MHAAYLDYKFSETEMKKVVSAVEETLPKSRKHTADFQVLMWWKLFGTYLFPMIARVPCPYCVHWRRVQNQRTTSLMQATR